MTNPEPELYRMMKFLLGEMDLTGTNAERRIKEVIAMGSKATQTYSLKDTTCQFNKNDSLYTEEQMTWIKQNLSEMLYFFGYAKVPQDPDNYTGFYDFTTEDQD